MDQWLDEITPSDLDQLVAAYEVGAFDLDDWLRTGWQCAATVNAVKELQAQWASTRLKPSDLSSPLDFMPDNIRKLFGKQKRRGTDPAELQRKMKERYGH